MQPTRRSIKPGIRNYFLFMVLLMGIQSAYAQESTINPVTSKFDTYRTQTIQEKIYVHLDRTFYYTGETVWFKVYAVDATLHKPLDISAVAYIEIVDFTNHAILQAK